MSDIATAYANLAFQKRLRLSGSAKSLADVRLELPNASQLVGYLDDFLPGGPSQYLDGELTTLPDGGWKLSIWVDTMDAEGVQYYDAQGNFLYWG